MKLTDAKQIQYGSLLVKDVCLGSQLVYTTSVLPSGIDIWTNSYGGNWNYPLNWSQGIVANAPSVVADVTIPPTGTSLTVTLCTSNISLSGLLFGAPYTTTPTFINCAVGCNIILISPSSATRIDVSPSSYQASLPFIQVMNYIQTPISIYGTLDINTGYLSTGYNGIIEFDSPIADYGFIYVPGHGGPVGYVTGNININGNGFAVFGANNIYTGITNVNNSGHLYIGRGTYDRDQPGDIVGDVRFHNSGTLGLYTGFTGTVFPRPNIILDNNINLTIFNGSCANSLSGNIISTNQTRTNKNNIVPDIHSGICGTTGKSIVNFSRGDAYQLDGYYGTYTIPSYSVLRFSSTGLKFNGSRNTTFISDGGTITTKYFMAKGGSVSLGALSGTGEMYVNMWPGLTITDLCSGTFVIGEKNIDCIYSGTIYDGVALNTTNTPITSCTTIYKAGSGMLSLSGNSTYSGGTVINSGIISVSSINALGVGGVVINAGASLHKNGYNIKNAIYNNGGTIIP
jgi:autotransporter-associated beta strand protein